MAFFTKEFWDSVLCKWIETLSSVKVWVIILTFTYAFKTTNSLIAAQAWGTLTIIATILTGVITPLVMMREGFKISKINFKKETTQKLIENNMSDKTDDKTDFV